MAGLLNDKQIQQYDILAIQEPWRNPFFHTTYNPTRDHFDLIYQNHSANMTRKGQWTYTDHSPDLITLSIRCSINDTLERTIHIHNIYNPSPSTNSRLGTLPLLEEVLQQYETGAELIEMSRCASI